jgi:hypothetical protein
MMGGLFSLRLSASRQKVRGLAGIMLLTGSEEVITRIGPDCPEYPQIERMALRVLARAYFNLVKTQRHQ